MITQFSCWKNDNKTNEKSPDYRLSCKVNDKWTEIGAGWLKKAGEKTYIAFSLSKEFKGKPGWELTPSVSPQEAPQSTKTLENDISPVWHRTPDTRVEEKDRDITPEQIDEAFNQM